MTSPVLLKFFGLGGVIFVVFIISPSVPQPHDDARLLGEVVGDVLDGGVLALVQVELFSNASWFFKFLSATHNQNQSLPSSEIEISVLMFSRW